MLDYIPDATAALKVLRLRADQLSEFAQRFRKSGDPNMARQLEDLADNIRSAQRVLAGAASHRLRDNSGKATSRT